MPRSGTRPDLHRVVVLALDEVIAYDLGVPTQIFHGARDANAWRYYDVRVATVDGGPVRSSAGFTIIPDQSPEEIATADMLIVTGIHGKRSPHMSAVLDPRARVAFD